MAPSENGVERLEANGEEQSAGAIYNSLSIVGAAIAVIGATITAFLLLIDVFTAEATGYAGLALLPPVLLSGIGFALFAGGWVREIRRRRRGLHSRFVDTWVINPLSIVRNVGLLVLLPAISVLTIALLTAGAGSVGVVEFSESNTFCSDVCHAVMSPEATVYHTTAHSRVACVECHVGSGAEGFMEAKIGGLRQVWAIATDSVQRPIPTPIHGRKIGREVCEKCHSPEREIGYRTLTRRYYLNGLEDSPIELVMIVKVGGGQNGLIQGGGIHYHMVTAQSVEFIARDRQRQDIAWIRATGPDGNVRVYENQNAPLTDEEKASLVPHKMDCVDCHSRPAHRFRNPVNVVDEALGAGRLPEDLFYIKEASVRALDGGYESDTEAMDGIGEAVRAYYEEEDPDVLEDRPGDITNAIEVLRDLYRGMIFPEMKASWRAHPNNVGHRDSPGCFRCHSEEMVDADGKAIFTSCTGCHAILAEGNQAIETAKDLDRGMGFSHPQDGAFIKDFKLCSNCHTGGEELYD